MRGTPRTSQPEFFDTPGYGAIARTHNHYSQALRIGERIEISGQGGWDRFIPDYFIKRAGTTIIDAAKEGLRQRMLRGKASDQAQHRE
jgi:enamine deaminase RidA (YjgF/YER057c/UK114 family)